MLYRFFTRKFNNNYLSISNSRTLHKKAKEIMKIRPNENDNITIDEIDSITEGQLMIPNNSTYRNNDPFHKPKVMTVKEPYTQEEEKQKFNKEPNFSNKFVLDPQNVDDYLVVGAEIFKNYFKDQIKQGKGLDTAVSGLKQLLQDNVMIKELRPLKTEEYGPLKEDLAFEADKVTPEMRFNSSRSYINIAREDRLAPTFVPNYKEETSRFNALKVFKTPFKNGSRSQHNKELIKTLSSISSIYSEPFDFHEPAIEEIINKLSELSKLTICEYPLDPAMVFSNDKFSRSIESKDLTEMWPYFKAEHILEIASNVSLLSEKINSLTFNAIPNLMLRLFLDINLNLRPLWVQLEQIIMNRLNHFSLEDILKINLVANISSPRYSSPELRKELINEILKTPLINYTFEQMTSIIISFRFNKDAELFNKFSTALVSNIENYYKMTEQTGKASKSKTSITKETILANTIFCLGYGKPSIYRNYDNFPRKEQNKENLMNLLDEISDKVVKMNYDEVIKVIHAISLLDVEEPIDFIANKVERVLNQIHSNKPFDSKQIGEVLKHFNIIKKGRMIGSDEFILKLLTSASEKLNTFEFEDFLEVLYSSSARRLDYDENNKLSKPREEKIKNLIAKFNGHLKQNLDKVLTYKHLSLIFYHLMYIKNEDKQLIDALIDRCNNAMIGVIPVKYYNSFKYFDFYLRNSKALKQHYNYENLKEFRGYFFYPEQVFNVYARESFLNKEIRLQSISHQLRARLFYQTTLNIPYNNMFIIPIAIETRKIAIFIYFERDYLPKSKKVSAKALLSTQMMSLVDNWEVMSMSWDEYLDLGPSIEREEKLYKLIEQMTDLQIKKGLFERNKKII